LRNRVQTIRRLQIDELHINPFLIRILAREMGWSDARAIVRWLVNQRLERGLVTSFGLALQEAAKVFSEGTGVEGADILKSKGGLRYYIQVKSGPNTIPKDLGGYALRNCFAPHSGGTGVLPPCLVCATVTNSK
jgi:hypothetical protein